MALEFDDRDRESIARDLESPDEDVRRLAVERVGGLPADEGLPLIVGCLGDSSWRVRKAAVERLVSHSNTEGLADALISALGDGDNPGRRNSAVETLVACGPRMVPSLLRVCSTDDADVRKFVVDALAGIGDPSAFEQLLDLLEDTDPNVRAAAADALGALGTAGGGEALLRAAVNPEEDATVRFSCLHALGALEEPLTARHLAPVLEDPILRAAALALLGRCDDEEAVAALLKGLAAGSRSVRESAMRSLLRVVGLVDGSRITWLVDQIRQVSEAAPVLVESAIARLEEADLGTRLVLVQFLGLLRDERAVVPVLLAGRDEALSEVSLQTLAEMGEIVEDAIESAWSGFDADARRDACTLFGRTGGERSAARLLMALEDGEPELRIAAARALGERRHTGALAQLVHRLENIPVEEDFEGEEEIIAVTGALIEIGQPRPGVEAVTGQAVELLRTHLDGAVETVRLAIARVLGCIGRREDTELVAFLLKDPSAPVRRAAVDALARLEPGTAAEPLRLALADEAATVRIGAASALGASESDEVMDDLLRLADDGDSRVRATAVRALGVRFGGSPDAQRRESALRVLDQALGDEALVALGAVEALSELGGETAARATGVLTRTEPELVKEAVSCLGKHAEVSALEGIVPLVSHPDWSVRAEAIQALAERRVVRAVPPILRRLETEQDEFVRDVILRALKRLED